MRRMHWSVMVIAVLGMVFSLGAGTAGAAYPEKPITIIIANNAGSATDLDTRAIAPFLEKALGQRILMENIGGVSGKIGLTRLWKAKPDGYTLLTHSQAEHLFLDAEKNPTHEFRMAELSHIGTFTTGNSILVVPSDSWKTFPELVKAGKERELVGGAAGQGSPSHYNSVLFAKKLGLKVRWVPFLGGGGEALAALAGKHTEFSVHTAPTILPLVKAGKIRPLLVMAQVKDKEFPDVPLAKDLGYDNLTFFSVTRGMCAPPKVPEPIMQRLDKALADAVKDPGYLAWAEARRAQIYHLNRVEYAKLIKEQQKEISENLDVIEILTKIQK